MRYIGVVLIAAAAVLGTVPGAGAQAPAAQPSAEALQAAKDLVAVTSPDTLAELTVDNCGQFLAGNRSLRSKAVSEDRQ